MLGLNFISFSFDGTGPPSFFMVIYFVLRTIKLLHVFFFCFVFHCKITGYIHLHICFVDIEWPVEGMV